MESRIDGLGRNFGGQRFHPFQRSDTASQLPAKPKGDEHTSDRLKYGILQSFIQLIRLAFRHTESKMGHQCFSGQLYQALSLIG
jgi:hypothetical protein